MAKKSFNPKISGLLSPEDISRLSSAPLPAPAEVLPPEPPKEDKLPSARDILMESKLCPMKELIRLYESDKKTVVTKEGVELTVPLSVGDKLEILSKLVEYGFPKPKSTEVRGSNGIVYNIQIVKFSAQKNK